MAFAHARWALPFLAALLPIILLSVYSLQISSDSVRNLVEATNLSAATNLSELITEDIVHLVEVGHAIATVPGTIDAVKTDDITGMSLRLKALVLTYPQVERAFVTDRKGLLWDDYPPVAGAFGTDESKSEWYKGISSRWMPYVSGAYVPYDGARSTAVAIALPIQDASGSLLGTLVMEYRTDQIARWIQDIHLGKSGFLFVVDQNVSTVAHANLPPDDNVLHTDYRTASVITQAQSTNAFTTAEYVDPFLKKDMIASFQPITVGGNRWTIVAQQPTDEGYSVLENVRYKIELAGLVLTLVTLTMVIALAVMKARNERLANALAAKNQTLQDITSFVSHQLRAPVTAMRWTIETMIDGDFGPVGGELVTALTSLRDVATQNGNLINDILNVSRIDRGVIEVAVAAVPLKDIAERALRDYRVALEKANLSLTLHGMDQDITVLADKEKMAEAVTNAISNAIKHTKKGGITVTVRKDDAFGYIDIADTGEGMSQDIMDKLFDRTGISGANTDSSASTGLGLYIARNFMHLQKGDILVSSELGKGSTFTYKIPLAGAAEPARS
jgi:signal transduction histidine kinase